jgi:cell division protein FtsI (penicillin-binding protein 3)
VDEHEAKGGTVLVMRTETGEILADANVERPVIEPVAPEGTTPTTTTPDDDRASEADDDEDDEDEDEDDEAAEPVYGPARPVGQNRAVTWTYEPGSVNKVITMAAVLEEGMATPEQRRVVASSLEVWDYKFNQEGRSAEQDLSLREILVHSDNLGTIAWATDLGEERLDSYLRRFGLGTKTALDFPFEDPGNVRPVDDWSGTSLPTIAIGQGLTVTPMQMLGVYNTIANDGVAIAPRLVLGTEGADGGFTPHETPAPQQVVSEGTATALRDMLAAVVREGTGQRAQVDGFSVGGKTGTAWKAQPGGYGVPGARQLVTTFAGFLPADDPELTILVVLDEPANPNSTGGNAAAPLFKQVATYAVHQLRLPPDAPADPIAGETDRVRAEPQPVSLPVVPPSTPGTTTTTAAPR